MKWIYHFFLLSGFLVLPATFQAQTFKTLYSFSNYANPTAPVIMDRNRLYGTTQSGGDFGSGSIFAVNTDGTGFTNLYSFTTPVGGPPYTNPDGSVPYAGLIASGSRVYGTTFQGGAFGDGGVFGINMDGTGFTNMHSFNGNDGYESAGSLLLSDGVLYGTASKLFKISTNGTGFTNFNLGVGGYGLVLSGGVLYGTATDEGTNGTGSIFSVNLDGSGFTNIYNFTAFSGHTNTDGANPRSRLVILGNTLYGTAYDAGAGGNGTIFSIHTDGTDFTNLHSFAPPPGNIFDAINSDGEFPEGNLLLSGHTLYGTTMKGGPDGGGHNICNEYRRHRIYEPLFIDGCWRRAL